ncbi:MAG TPA: lysophospholipid acyltransferase family protein, partial [Roseiflexaceae bacterium]|nr:lysophospholipid acyltransferase family protein [Roseiflexaceae bacterium]
MSQRETSETTSPLPEQLHCQATTRAGQPCRNRPLEGQPFCRVHAPLAGAGSAAPTDAVHLQGGTSAEPIVELGAPETVMLDGVGIAEEIAIGGGTAAPDTQQMRDETIVAIEELEVEIRNQESVPAESRELAADALRLVRENLLRMAAEPLQQAQRLIRENLTSDYLDPDFWRGLGMVLRYQAEATVEMLQRRVRGEYSTDIYGMDMELIEVVRPFLAFMYRQWWRVSAEGLEHVPDNGRALLVSNHSGVLPWDGAMIGTAILDEHSSPRVLRCLHLSWFSTLPVVAPALAAFGQVQALPENAIRLLEDDELVCVFPEGLKGVGKLFKDRYKLARFGRGGFVQMALRTGAPLLPVAVIGAEETYPMLANVKPVARLLGFPYFPLTPLFPWFGLLGFVPLPSKWTIVFHEPIPTAEYGPHGADDPLLVSELA